MASEKYGGAFRWESLLCRLIENVNLFDFSPSADTKHAHALAALAGVQADVFGDIDATALSPLPPLDDLDTKATLFHEQIHYWQLLSSPLMQSIFMTALQKIRVVVTQNGGIAKAVCGDAGADQNAEAVINALKRARQLVSPAPLPNAETRWQKRIISNPPTEVAALLVTSAWDHEIYPGYVAALGYTADKFIPVDVNIQTLSESSANISEMHYRKSPIGRLDECASDELVPYRGLWELWMRYHGHRTDDETILSNSFLAVIDLALLGGLPHPLLNFSGIADFPAERFGRLFAVSADEPLVSGEIGDSLAQYQDNLARRCKLRSVNEVVEAARCRILRMLLFSLSNFIDISHETWTRWIDQLHATPETPVESQPIVDAVIGAFLVERVLPVGAQVLAVMFNALTYRLRQREAFIAPARHAEALEERFSLPLVMVEGQYYQPNASIVPAEPIPIWTGMLRQDIISLTAIYPMMYASTECGFLHEGLDCLYTANGMGCPRSGPQGLSQAQKELRAETRLMNWCHNTRLQMLLGLARGKEAQYWFARAQKFAEDAERSS